MDGGQNKDPARGQAQPGQEGHKANAAGRYNVAQAMGWAKRACLYQVQPEIGDAFAFEVTGRNVLRCAVRKVGAA